MPENLKVRMVLPSGGLISVSLWDVDDPESLKAWLDENLGQDCANEVNEVQEAFTFGVALELARARAAEKMTSGGLKTIGALGERTTRAAEAMAASVNERLGEFDKRTGVLTSAKETTNATVSKLSEAVAKAAENERVQHVVAGVQQGVANGWSKVAAWMGSGARQPVDYYGAAPTGGSAYQTMDFGHQDSLDRPLSSAGTDLGVTHPPVPVAPPAAAAAAQAAAAATGSPRAPPVSMVPPST